jgi:hypothetical protein
MRFEDHVAHCVEQVLRTVPAHVRDDVCMLGVWIDAGGTASIGWNTSRRLQENQTPWEWSQ